ncbi:MAG: UDP-N-acetylmuramoyl-tripeptide--D-alanyl-D-alanine ligase [Bacteroidota bacterium]|jgi:UDP-N-acetylmuramoyl-tripeptide--D-alanyl-D-alanine ligase
MLPFDAFLECRKVSTDTRNIEAGCVFFALKGANFNGNQFALQALAEGAAYAIVDEPVGEDERLILVEDVLTALQDCARTYRKYLAIPVISLTGSNGKTTNKELFAAVLSKKYRVHATKGNFNNHIGVPLTLLAIEEGTEVAVVEMGANHQKEIAALSRIALPDVGYITNYGKAHLEGFGGVEGIIKGKSELYDFLREEGGDLAEVLLNVDDALQVERSVGLKAYTFGTGDEQVHVQWKALDRGELAAIAFKAEGRWWEVQSHLSGAFNCTNMAAAVALGLKFGVQSEEIVAAIESYVPAMNRVEWRKTQRNKVLLDAYNANPTSMALSVESFVKYHADGWMVLGDMFELGQASAVEHQGIVDQIEAAGMSARTILVGAHFGGCRWSGLCFGDVAELVAYWNGKGAPKDAHILLKGSRGIALERLLPLL